MKRWWLCLVSVLLLAACSNEIPEGPVMKNEGRAVLAYIVSNNSGGDLDGYLKDNVRDMYKGLVTRKEASTLLVYYRPKKYDVTLEHPSILKFATDGKGNVNGKPALTGLSLTADNVIAQAEAHPYTEEKHVATDPAVMKRILQDMIKLAPATSYGLTLGSHGTGWLEGNQVSRAFGDDHGYNINIPELAATLREAFAKEKLDYILFDACMMANAEVAYELRDVTDYCIASVLETPVYGFPYANLMDELFNKQVNYQQVCDEFIHYNQLNELWGTCAAIDCSKMQELADWVKVNLDANKEKLASSFYNKVQQYGRFPFKNYSFDVVDVFRQMKGEEPAELLALMDEIVVAKNCLSGTRYEFGGIVIDKSRFCGMGMYLPYRFGQRGWDSYYLNSIAWAKAVDWMKYRP